MCLGECVFSVWFVGGFSVGWVLISYGVGVFMFFFSGFDYFEFLGFAWFGRVGVWICS